MSDRNLRKRVNDVWAAVWDHSHTTMEESEYSIMSLVREVVAEAVAEERQACAAVADAHQRADELGVSHGIYCAQLIACVIRNRGGLGPPRNMCHACPDATRLLINLGALSASEAKGIATEFEAAAKELRAYAEKGE